MMILCLCVPLEMPKRRRAPTSPIDLANRKNDEEFARDYLVPGSAESTSPWVVSWTHPRTGDEYNISLARSSNLEAEALGACFGLIEQTSADHYRNSAGKWRPRKKMEEMRSPEMRYILVRDKKSNTIRGFTSLMPTYEGGEPVIYCYEIHLDPSLQGTGLGSLLMSFHSTVAQNLPPVTKVMLTCFLSNQRGLDFYRKLGFEEDAISPEPRDLRNGKRFLPDYVILSKTIRPASDSGAEKHA
ncbi:hypothetical protein VTK26DRAFT_3037 [Humicola hyalothermophila]